MSDYTVILNPISGRGTGLKSKPFIEETLKQHKLNFVIQTTEYPGHAIQLAKKAASEGSRVVVAVGGDGTSNEVINGLVQAKQEGLGTAAMGCICVGRGNDFGYSAGVPATISAACQAFVDDQRWMIDVGFVQGGIFPEGRYFGNGVGIGFDAVVGFEALKLKRLHGFPSYIVAALKTIFLYYRAPTLRVEMDGKSFTQPALMISIMNGRRLGGGFMIAPQGQMDDGQFDLCIADQVSRPTILSLIPRFMKGTQGGHPAIHMHRTDRLQVSAVNGVIPAHADGETLCEAGESLQLHLVPKALELVIPAPGRP
jgi:YegS/Rv2252/BmrU family lipid kinase